MIGIQRPVNICQLTVRYYVILLSNNKRIQMKQIGNKLVNELNHLEDKNTKMKEIVDDAAVKMQAAALKYSTLKRKR